MARITGADPVLPGRFLVGTAAATCVAATTQAAADLFRERGGEPGEVAVDVRHVAHAFRSERYLRINDEPPADLWAHVSGDYRGADGWIKIHANYPHHARAAAAVLGVPREREAFASAIAARPVREAEEAVHAAGGVAAALRTAEEWAAHPAGQAARAIPLVDVERIAPSARQPLPPGPRPLSGVRVLDLTHVIAGPLCGRTLSAHGADVLHIGAAHLPILLPLHLDHGFDKRDAFLDLRTESGRATLRDPARDRRRRAVRVGSHRPAGDAARLRLAGADVQRHRGRTLGKTPRPLPAQVLDHATGWLAAGAAITGLRRRASEGGSWRARLALARTAAWFTDLGRLPEDVAEADEPLPEDLMTETASFAGTLRHIRIPGELPGAPPGWRHGARQPGSDQPTWHT